MPHAVTSMVPMVPMVPMVIVAPTGDGSEGAMAPSEMMMTLYRHLDEHDYFPEPYAHLGPIPLHFSNHNLALLIASGIVLLAFGWLAMRRRKSLLPTGKLENCLEALVSFVKNDMVYANMGEHHGRRFLPLFLSQFFVILVMNLFGVLPNFDFFRSMHFPATATANVNVTAALALTTFGAMLYGGIKEQGFRHYFVGLAPPIHLGDSAGMKAMRVAILSIMYPIEALGLLIKPFALTIRLFANMLGGHLAMLTIYGLIYLFQSYAIAPIGVGFNVFLTFLELLVAGIQAYVFTYLSILFVSASVHPEH